MKKKHISSIAAAIAGVLLVPFVFWAGGYDFNERGETAVLCVIFTLFVSGFGAVLAAQAHE